MHRALIFILLFSSSVYAENNRLIFEKIFLNWTNAFNQQDLTGSCNLFAKNIVADYQGVPQKNYSSICDGFKKIFSQKEKQYRYKYTLHQIYRKDNLAAVRITWYLTITENKKIIETVQDEGIDIFEEKNGEWKIVNYLGFPKL